MKDLGKREKTMLLVLAVLLPILLWQYIGPMFSGGGATIRDRQPQRENRGVADREVVTPRLADLEVGGGRYEQGRNIFAYGEKPKPPPPPPAPPPPATTPRVAPPPPPPVVTTPQPPPIDIALLGIFGSKKRRIAAIEQNEALLNVVVGEVIDDKFIVHSIDYESIALGFVGFPDVEPERVVIGE